jgi:hypothetical protein
MTTPLQPDLDNLAYALARLLATYWQCQLHVTATKQSRAPPVVKADRTDDQFDPQAVTTVDAEKE